MLINTQLFFPRNYTLVIKPKVSWGSEFYMSKFKILVPL